MRPGKGQKLEVLLVGFRKSWKGRSDEGHSFNDGKPLHEPGAPKRIFVVERLVDAHHILIEEGLSRAIPSEGRCAGSRDRIRRRHVLVYNSHGKRTEVSGGDVSAGK